MSVSVGMRLMLRGRITSMDISAEIDRITAEAMDRISPYIEIRNKEIIEADIRLAVADGIGVTLDDSRATLDRIDERTRERIGGEK